MIKQLLPIFLAVASLSIPASAIAQNPVRMHAAPTSKALSPTKMQHENKTAPTTLIPENFALDPNPAKALPSTSALRHAPAADAEVLLYQDFSLMTEGSEEELGPDVVPNYSQGDMYIPEEYTGQEGWYGMGLYSAGEKVALAYPSVGGVINTPMMNMFGRLIVTTRVKVREGNTGPVIFYINCVKGSIMNPTAANNLTTNQKGSALNMYRQSAEDGWVEITTEIYNTTENEDCWIQVNATTYSKNGIMIDEIKVERDYEFCTPPYNLISYDFTNDGFTARWEPGYNNESYLLSLWEERKDGDDVTVTETFDNISISDNGMVDPSTMASGLDIWLGSEGPQVSEDGGADGTKAIILDANDDFVAIPDMERPVIGGSVYLKSEVIDGSYAMLYVMGMNGYYSEVAGGIPLSELTEGSTINLNDYVANISSYTCIGFQPNYMQPGESVILDNFTWTILAPTVTTQVREDMPVDNNIVVLTDLDPECNYSFSVKGVSDSGLVSDPSSTKMAIGCPAPEALPAENVEADAYTARWTPSIKAEGYLVRNFELTTVSKDEDDYTVLEDSFCNADGQAINYIDGSLDGIADMKGWTALYGIYSHMGVGTMYDGEIVTPPLDLSHDNGKFKVKAGAWIFSGCGIVVQCNTTSYKVAMAPESPSGDMEMDYYEFEMEFEDGTSMSNLYIYSYEGNGFFIDEIEILQNVKAGDKEITMIDAVEVDGHDTDSLRLTDLDGKCDYAYTVTALSSYHGASYSSLPSNLIEVGTATGINQTSAEDAVVTVDNTVLRVKCAKETSVSVYSSDGKVIASEEIAARDFSLSLPAVGPYIVKVGNKVHKIMAF